MTADPRPSTTPTEDAMRSDGTCAGSGKRASSVQRLDLITWVGLCRVCGRVQRLNNPFGDLPNARPVRKHKHPEWRRG
jgi:hypothetical protein